MAVMASLPIWEIHGPLDILDEVVDGLEDERDVFDAGLADHGRLLALLLILRLECPILVINPCRKRGIVSDTPPTLFKTHAAKGG